MPNSKNNIFLILLIALFLAVLPPAGSWMVCKRLEKRLDVKIEGDFVPAMLLPVFYLKNTRFEWKGKVRFEKGDLRVAYEPLSFFSRKGVRIRLSGKDLEMRLLGDWATMQGVEKTHLEKFEADFSVGAKGLNEIYYSEAQSKAFQFHIKKSENNSTAGLRENKR